MGTGTSGIGIGGTKPKAMMRAVNSAIKTISFVFKVTSICYLRIFFKTTISPSFFSIRIHPLFFQTASC
jgi:hypothetical protein